MSIALVMFIYYNLTIIKTNILCLPCSCTVINTTRLVNHLVNRLVNRLALFVVTVATTVVAAATATVTAAVTAALAYDIVG
jgi:TRAP-type mannitol/chloroaromatic compound transport system permease large subunit